MTNIQKVDETNLSLSKRREYTILHKCVSKEAIKDIISTSVSVDKLSRTFGHPSLSSITELMGEQYTHTALSLVIQSTIDSMLANTSIKQELVLLSAGLIADRYSGFNLWEIKYAITSGCLGMYGKHYGTVDISYISNWLESYLEQDRIKAYSAFLDKKEKQQKAEEEALLKNAPPCNPERLNELSEKIKQMETLKKQEIARKDILKRNSMYIDFIDLCYQENIEMGKYNSYLTLFVSNKDNVRARNKELVLIQHEVVFEYNKYKKATHTK